MKKSVTADTVIVLDFETTGLSPDQGDRTIEVGAVRIENGQITDRFQHLMNPGRRINTFIEDYTGITNSMLENEPPCDVVMREFADFIEDFNLVAHNASFDRRFLIGELNRLNLPSTHPFACSMLVSRRLYQNAPNHKLGTLVAFKDLPTDGTFHRALADAEMAAHLWLQMLTDLKATYGIENVKFSVMQQLGKTAKHSVDRFLARSNLQ